MTSPPVALSIAGSDNSAGAGAQADLKTFSALGVYGLTAITCVVAEIPGRVSSIQPVDPALVREQILLCLEAYPVEAIKTGMLHARDIIEVVCETVAGRGLPLVVDPVMVATSGGRLLREDAVALYEERLFPLATLVTPNLDEVAALLGSSSPIRSREEMHVAGATLQRRFGVPFLIKGGHLRGERAVDLLFTGGEPAEFSAPFVPGINTHGTGCTYSAAIAAGLARGLALQPAVEAAKEFVTAAIASAFRWMTPAGATDALNHQLR